MEKKLPYKYNKKKKYGSAALVFAAGCFWGCMGLLVRMLDGYGMDSLEIALVRVGVAALFMVLGVPVADRSLLRIRLKDLWCFVGTGICSLAVFSAAYFRTMTLTSLSVAAVLLYTAPVFVAVLSFFLFGESLNRRKITAVFLTFAGCLLVTGVLSEKPALSGTGLFFGLLSGFGYALYSIFSRYAMQRGYGSVTITVYTFLFCFIGVLPFVKAGHVVSCLQGNDVRTILWIIFLVFLVTVAPYLCYTKGLAGLENGEASVIASVEPVMATVIGMAVFGEKNTVLTWLGIVLVLFSIGLVSIERGGEKK